MKMKAITSLTVAMVVIAMSGPLTPAFATVNGQKQTERSSKSNGTKTAGLKGETGSEQIQPKNLSREVIFDGSMVNGRYHMAGEAVATVEDEKPLNDLIGLRRDFKDRLADEYSRLKNANTNK